MKKEQVDYKENLIGELCRNEFEIIPLDDWRYCYYDGRTAKQLVQIRVAPPSSQ